jgi:hypothetical protein
VSSNWLGWGREPAFSLLVLGFGDLGMRDPFSRISLIWLPIHQTWVLGLQGPTHLCFPGACAQLGWGLGQACLVVKRWVVPHIFILVMGIIMDLFSQKMDCEDGAR